MTKVKRKALSLLLIATLLFSVVPQAPALAAKGARQLADSISKIVVTDSTVLQNEDDSYSLGDDSATFIIEVTASDSNAWASASNAEKASISNATSSDAEVATVEAITEENFEGFALDGELLGNNNFWLEVSPVPDAESGSTADITISVGEKTTSITVRIGEDAPVPTPVITITAQDGTTEVEAGHTLQLTATHSPSNAEVGNLTWSSDKPFVATVDSQSGLVTGMGKGTATVTVASDLIDIEPASIDITVMESATSDDVLVQKIEIFSKDHSYTAGVGEAREFFTFLYPYNVTNRELVWSSSDESIVAITPSDQPGQVIVAGVKGGTVTITAAATDGSGISASVNFEVIDIEQVNNVTVNGGRKAKVRLGRDRMVPVATDPKEAIGLVQEWTSSNPDIFEAGGGGIYGLSEGTATLSVTIQGVTGTCEVEVWAQQLELALSRTKMELQQGKETRIKAIITRPDVGEVGMTQWESSNPNVLEVLEGFDMGAIVKAKTVGKAVLTATLDGKQTTCEITVTKDTVKPTPADKIDEILERNLEQLENGTPEQQEQAAVAIINAAQDTLKDVDINSLSADDVLAISYLEEVILQAGIGKFDSTDWDHIGNVDLMVNEINGALLNLPIDWNTTGPVRAMLTVENADTSGLKLPTGVTGARAFDIKLAAVSGSRSEDLNNLKVPVEIKMEMPEEFSNAKNLWVYNYHGNEVIKIKPTVIDGEMSMVVKKFSTFVLMDVPDNNNGYSGGGGSSSFTEDRNLRGQWIQDSIGWWFEKSAGGYPQNEWAMINNKWYHFNTAGYMETGWILLNNVWYYLKPQGDMASKEWILDNGKHYYLHENGSMLTNTNTPDGYRVDESGAWIQ